MNSENKSNEITEQIEYEVIKSCCGENENGKPRATLTGAIIEYHGDINDEEAQAQDYNYRTIATRMIHNGALAIEARDSIIQIDINFKSYLDPELRLLWDLLETYGQSRAESFMNPESDFIPHVFIEIISEDFDGQYVLSLTNPILWFLQPKSPEEEQLSVIRLFFNPDGLEVQDISDVVDVTQAEAEVMRTYDTILTEK